MLNFLTSPKVAKDSSLYVLTCRIYVFCTLSQARKDLATITIATTFRIMMTIGKEESMVGLLNTIQVNIS